ncbi:MAG TPA: cobyrinate a,c-diamide synthase, partial [Methylophilaceae bacterium]|nr:cobyrinate a,c-diamide synthase [Methylophilaceae bacterium]
AMPRLLDGKTIAVARDEAFCFLYPANLDCLQALGARLTFFSPLHDSALPEAEAVWLPGGYPELHMSALSANRGMRDSLRQALAGGMPMLAECGGMMALSASIDDRPAFGLLPGKSRIDTKLQGIGTQTVELAGGRLHAHTFHHGIFDTSLPSWQTADSPYGNGEAIYRSGSLLASFLHFYFPSNPAVAAGFFL